MQWSNKNQIHTWKQFAKQVRTKGCRLLSHLDNFPNSILITGCQRSGTTMLSRVITQSNGMVNYWFGHDDELAAALILSGWVSFESAGRYCFQTTYVNECLDEYFNIRQNHHIVWVLRNPLSVVYSMVYNWKRFALNELFMACGTEFLNDDDRNKINLWGAWSIRRIKKACFAYNGKLKQLDKLLQKKGDMICVVDYDDLVRRKYQLLPQVYDFINLEYMKSYADSIHSKSLKKQTRLSEKDINLVNNLCIPSYEASRRLIKIQ